jgi:hypothetical protein
MDWASRITSSTSPARSASSGVRPSTNGLGVTNQRTRPKALIGPRIARSTSGRPASTPSRQARARRQVGHAARMGLLDDVLWNLGPEVPTLAGRRARRVLRDGEASEATIVGIRVERTTDGETIEPEYRYALDVRTGFGTSRVGVRQRLGVRRGDAHVGATVPVKLLDDKVVIDWGRHLEAEGELAVGTWRMVDPPPEGVEDRWRKGERKRIDAGTKGSITVLRVTPVVSALGPTENLDLDVQLQADGADPEIRRLDRVWPPDYARFLVKVGAILPVGIDKDGSRITIDWERAANGGSGFDAAPPEAPPPTAPRPGPPDRAISAVDAFVTRRVGAGDPTAVGDVTLETYVEIQVGLILDRVAPADADAYAARHGVPTGTWATVDAAWKARTMTAEYGTQFGALFSARMKAAKKERKKRR